MKISWPSYWESSTTNAQRKISDRSLKHWPVLTKTTEEWGRKRKALTVKAIILWKSVRRMMRLLILHPEKKNNSCFKYGNLKWKNPKIYQKKLISWWNQKLSKSAFSLRTIMALCFTPLKHKTSRKPLKISTAMLMSINLQNPSKKYVKIEKRLTRASRRKIFWTEWKKIRLSSSWREISRQTPFHLMFFWTCHHFSTRESTLRGKMRKIWRCWRKFLKCLMESKKNSTFFMMISWIEPTIIYKKSI